MKAMKSAHGLLIMGWGVLFAFLAGCSIFNPMGTTTTLEQQTLSAPRIANVAFRLVFPEQSAGELHAAIRGDTPEVTFQLLLIDVSKPDNPVVTLSKTVPVSDGTATTEFHGVPARSVVARVSVRRGHLMGYSEFHGAKDLLPDEENIIELAPQGSRLDPDLAASTLLALLQTPNILSDAPEQLVGLIQQHIQHIDPEKPFIVADLLDTTVVSINPPGLTILTGDPFTDTLIGTQNGSQVWQRNIDSIWAVHNETEFAQGARVKSVIRAALPETPGLLVFESLSATKNALAIVDGDGQILAYCITPGLFTQVLPLSDGSVLIGGFNNMLGTPFLCRWDTRQNGRLFDDAGLEAGLHWRQYFLQLAAGQSLPVPGVEHLTVTAEQTIVAGIRDVKNDVLRMFRLNMTDGGYEAINPHHVPNRYPIIQLTAPPADAVFPSGARITLVASATDIDGTIASVSFWVDSVLIGSTSTSAGISASISANSDADADAGHYTWEWLAQTPGSFTLSAQAADDLGAVSRSPVVQVTILEGAIQPLAVVWRQPAEQATEVAQDAHVVVEFDQAIATDTLNTDTFIVARQDEEPMTGSFNSADGTTWSFVPAKEFVAGATYTVTLTTDIESLIGAVFAEIQTWEFVTWAPPPDTVPPTVVAVLPPADAVDVATSAVLMIEFSEAMALATLNPDSITLACGSTPLSGTVSASADGLLATFTPAAALPYSALLTASVRTGVTDTAGNALEEPFVWSFSTQHQQPAVLYVTSPKTVGTYFQGEAIDIEVHFDSPVNVTGSPRLALETGITGRFAAYLMGDGSKTLVFRMTVERGDVSGALDYTDTNALSLAGGTIRSGGGIDADLALPTPGSADSLSKRCTLAINGDVAPYTAPQYALLSILAKKILRVAPTMEYSLDDGSSWNTCTSGEQAVNDLQVGNKVWVRRIGDDSTRNFLGEVQALSGCDLVAGNELFTGTGSWVEKNYGYANEQLDLRFWFRNIGDVLGFNAQHRIRVYLSSDRQITAEDHLLDEVNFSYACTPGRIFGENQTFTVPDLPAGIYYLGIIVDATEKITEMNEDNNTTLPDDVYEFRIVKGAASPTGAFKIVNSWGKGVWENKADGHYWMTYNTVKQQELYVFYHRTNVRHSNRPTIVAVFQIAHSTRKNCAITFGLGDHADPVRKKEFKVSELSGSYAFPANKIIYDLSEFAGQINDYNLFMQVRNDSTSAGNLATFSIECYSDYDAPPIKILAGSTGPIAEKKTVSFEVASKNAFSGNEIVQISPMLRAAHQGDNLNFVESIPTADELAQDMNNHGLRNAGMTANKIIKGRWGTGYLPPTLEEWQTLKKLREVSSVMLRGSSPQSVDNSRRGTFPPIGDQGSKGACTCFSLGYYIHTYNLAEKNGWDLSDVTWLSVGGPDKNKDKIFSPDFLYNQINGGTDGGASGEDAASLLINMGCATWEKMPYNVNDLTTWPTEEAYREAARYRGMPVEQRFTGYTDDKSWSSRGYFVIRTDAEINYLKTLLADGYCVMTAVNSDWTYYLLTDQDVIDNDTLPKIPPDHAQTIVGYKEGDAWNPVAPDN